MSVQAQNPEAGSSVAVAGARNPVKVSVAIITYNHESFIRQAMESVLAQQVNFEYEIIVAEDCSTDCTRGIVMDFYGRYPERIVPVVQERNVGMVRNLDAALAACRGQYLALLEGDDYWTCADKLQRLVDFMDQHLDYAICCHRVQLCDDTGAGRNEIWPPPHYKGDFYTIEDLILWNFVPTCSAVMYRSNSVSPFPEWFFDFQSCDWPLHILVAGSGRIKVFDDVMGVYRLHSTSLFSSRPGVDQKKLLVPMLKALDRHFNFKYSNVIARTLAVLHFDMAIIARMDGNRLATLRYLIASIRSGKLPMAGRWRALATLAAYSVLGIRRPTQSSSVPAAANK